MRFSFALVSEYVLIRNDIEFNEQMRLSNYTLYKLLHINRLQIKGQKHCFYCCSTIGSSTMDIHVFL